MIPRQAAKRLLDIVATANVKNANFCRKICRCYFPKQKQAVVRLTVQSNHQSAVLGFHGAKSFSTLTPLQKRILTLPKGLLRKMKVDDGLLSQVISPEVKVLAKLFEENNYELRLAGGPVRDLLMDKIPADLDFATTATPTQMKAMFEAAGIRMLNTKGELHGTITARINDKENFEVTTLRIDVVTDGRHAEVAFTTDWELDAARRDLTVNSMFMDLSGNVYDYFNGSEDLKTRQIRFVGDAEQRIQEDYLRILRYFRFYGRLARECDTHEEETLSAIQRNAKGLQGISGERLWMELKKIAAGKYSKELVLRMLSLDVGQYIGFNGELDLDEFKSVCERLERLELEVNPITRLTALLRTDKDATMLNGRLKMSAFERDLSLFIILHRKTTVAENSIKPLQKLIIFSKSKSSDVRQWIVELLKYSGKVDLLQEFEKWEIPKFPVSGNILIENKVPAGRTMSRVITELKEIWVDSDFNATTEDLVAQLPQILEYVSSKSPKSKS